MNAQLGTRNLVLFVCRRNAGASQMAAAFFNRHANSKRVFALSAGVEPAAQLHPNAVAAMEEIGFDMSEAQPRGLTPELVGGATLVVTLASDGDAIVVSGARCIHWAFPTPPGATRDYARHLRGDICARVMALVRSEGWRPDHGRRVGI